MFCIENREIYVQPIMEKHIYLLWNEMIRVDLTNVFIFCMKSIMYCQNTIIFFMSGTIILQKKYICEFFFQTFFRLYVVYTNDEGQYIICEVQFKTC